MSENPRLREWLEKYEGGKMQNPSIVNNRRNVTYIWETEKHNKFNYVGFWRRFLAYFIDSIVLTVIAFMLTIDSFFLLFVLHTLYFSLLQVSPLQGTVGKAAIGAVVTEEKGNKLNFTRSLARALSMYLSVFLLLIGFIMIAANSKKKGLHDMISGSLVINKK